MGLSGLAATTIMGTRKSRAATGKAGKAAAGTLAGAPAGPAHGNQTAFDLLSGTEERVINERINDLLESIKAKPVLTRLKANGYSDFVAQVSSARLRRPAAWVRDRCGVRVLAG